MLTRKMLLWPVTLASLALLPVSDLRASETVPPFKKVVLVLFENQNMDKALTQPFFSQLAEKGALLTDYRAVAHPSEPNYIALTSGDTQGITDDKNYDLDVRHLGDLLEEKGKTWKNYAEDYPGNCFLGAKKGLYARKHTPFLSYTNVSKTPRCKKIVNASQFATDVKNNTLPDFSFYTPNMDDDVHDTDITYGDHWFKRTFGPLLRKPGFKDVLLVVTFDENECNTVGPFVTASKIAICKGDENRVYTVFFGRGIKAGTTSNVTYTHYSLLKTIEAGFKLDTLGRHDRDATIISGIWAKKRMPKK